MVSKKRSKKKPIEAYDHKGKKRPNNPPVGLVTPQTDPDEGKERAYEYDPHLDPQLVWASKAERTSFEVPTVSLHVHERIEPRTILEAVRKRNGDRSPTQGFLFEAPDENLPLREALDFYKHPHGWSNRLIAGDSLLVMNSLLEKEGLAGQVQMVYIDPPYGVSYKSNFQPFVGKRDVKDNSDEDLTQEPEMVRAFRDTWELGIHSYLSYLRDRLLLAKELLTESGSCFVQISDENLHHVCELMDEIFGSANFAALIAFQKTAAVSSPQARTNVIGTLCDYVVWYARSLPKIKYRQLFLEKGVGLGAGTGYRNVLLPDGSRRLITDEEIADPSSLPRDARVYQATSLQSAGYSESLSRPFVFGGARYSPADNAHWKTTLEGLGHLARKNRVVVSGNSIRYVRYVDDFPASPLASVWMDVMGAQNLVYVVQTNPKVIQRCLLMTTDPGDLVFDPTCGSGTTAYVAEQWGRRWITCDTSRVAITVARQRLMTALYDYYELARPDEGVGSGFRYKTVPHVTLKSIANDEPPAQETLYDQPFVDKSRARVTGPFTVEAVPALTVKPLSPIELTSDATAPSSAEVGAGTWLARTEPTARHAEWRAELLKTGIRGKAGQTIRFSRVEPLGGTRWLHADAETLPSEKAGAGTDDRAAYGKPQRVVVSFGPEYAPLEQRQVELAWEEARSLDSRPAMVLFAAFQFDPEAAKDIDETDPKKAGMTFLKVQMNADLLTEDLKKKRASNQSFWLIGQPDVELRKRKDGKYEVEVRGFDYYNTRTGDIESGDVSKIALWMLDTDYDGRSVYPRQFFFPMAGVDNGWAKLAKNLKAEIDSDLIEKYRGTVSLPFEAGESRRIAVKIVDDRGIESLRVEEIEGATGRRI
jgi:adenine-specific DNA-methyltransferase